MSSPRVSMGVHSARASGPATAHSRPSARRTQGTHRPVAEADDEVHAHGDLAPDGLDHPHHLGMVLADGHAVDHLGDAVGGLELRLEHEGVAAVAAPRPRSRRVAGAMRQYPCSSVAEQLGEAGVGVEPGQAQPVDRPVAAHQRRGVGVADDPVVLDRQRHGRHSYPPVPSAAGRRATRRSCRCPPSAVAAWARATSASTGGHGQRVAHVGVGGRAGEHDADDGAVGDARVARRHQGTARVARLDHGVELVDLAGRLRAPVDVEPDGLEGGGHARLAGGERPATGIPEDDTGRAPRHHGGVDGQHGVGEPAHAQHGDVEPGVEQRHRWWRGDRSASMT